VNRKKLLGSFMHPQCGRNDGTGEAGEILKVSGWHVPAAAPTGSRRAASHIRIASWPVCQDPKQIRRRLERAVL
jgi:hypothetical protein